MPSQLLDAALEVLLYIVSTLVLVVLQHNALEQSLWELELTNFLLHVGTYIKQELVITVLLKLGCNRVGNLLTEFLLVLDGTFTENTVEELLIYFCRLEMTDFCNLVAEVGSQILDVVFLNLQKCSNLCVIVGISLLGIEGDDVASLCTVEKLALIFVLDISRHHHRTLGGDTTFLGVTVLVKLAHVTSEGVITAEHISLYKLTALRLIHGHLVVDEFLVGGDGVVINLIFSCELSLEVWCDGNIEYKSQILVFLKVLWNLLLIGQRLAQHLDIVLLDVCIQLLAKHFVYFVNLGCCAILLLNHSHGHHTWTETRNLGLLTIILQGLLYRILVVCRFNGHRQQTIDLVGAFK